MATDVLLNDRMARNEFALAGEINRTSLNTSIFNKLIIKEPWPNGMSDILQTVTVERNLPANIDAWTAIAPNDGTNTCVPVADVVPRGHTTRQYSLEQKAIESDNICVEDGRNAYQVNDQIRAMFDNLRKAVAYAWKRKAQLSYVDVSQNKIVVHDGLPVSASHFPTIAPTSPLTQKVLDKIYMQLISNSAQLDGGSLGMADGRPQFILVTDAETSNDIMEETKITQAFLYNDKRVPELLSPLGVDRAFKGYYHTIENLPRRFNFVGNAWVEVLPYATVAADVGFKAQLRTEYMQAPYTESYVYLPSVFHFVVPNSITSFGSGSSFMSQDYIGEIKWHNEYDRQDNPDRTYGYYRAVMKVGVKAIRPEFGFAIRHLRCRGDLDLRSCESADIGATRDLESGESFLI